MVRAIQKLAVSRRRNPDQAWSRRPAVGVRSASGFTLLEVILALAILGLALATLGQAVGRSHESARRAADESELCLTASTTLEEILSGVRPLQAIESEAVPDPRDPTAPPVALVSATVEPGPLDGLLVVRVAARPNDPAAGALETVTLTRWLVDPSLESDASTTETAP